MGILYVSYGSNMNIRQMAFRCPTAKVVGNGKIKDYRLLFKGCRNNAHATIEPHKGKNTPVLVWEIEKLDEKFLDRYEGYPSYYRKETIEVKLENGEVVQAMVYIMNDEVHGTETVLNLPNPSYYATIREGYKSAGFNIKHLVKATEISAKALRV
jgi:gamma-glutamylcyclotransferase (GGCT)/AIG2-like uncharacterized protein YtfP